MFIYADNEESTKCSGSNAAAFCLKLPGKSLYLTPLLKVKKFRNFGYKTGAMCAFRELETAQLGTLEEFGAGKGTRTVSIYKNVHECVNALVQKACTYTSLGIPVYVH